MLKIIIPRKSIFIHLTKCLDYAKGASFPGVP